MRRGRLAGLIIVVALALSGCAGFQAELESLRNPLPGFSTLKIGVTTQDEVLSKYGTPVEVWGGNSRQPVLIYPIDTTHEARLLFNNGVLVQKGVYDHTVSEFYIYR
jgi:hypothetical protein